jgi:hypothetical protein
MCLADLVVALGAVVAAAADVTATFSLGEYGRILRKPTMSADGASLVRMGVVLGAIIKVCPSARVTQTALTTALKMVTRGRIHSPDFDTWCSTAALGIRVALSHLRRIKRNAQKRAQAFRALVPADVQSLTELLQLAGEVAWPIESSSPVSSEPVSSPPCLADNPLQAGWTGAASHAAEVSRSGGCKLVATPTKTAPAPPKTTPVKTGKGKGKDKEVKKDIKLHSVQARVC